MDQTAMEEVEEMDDGPPPPPYEVDEAKAARDTWAGFAAALTLFSLSTAALCAYTTDLSTPGILGSPEERAAASLNLVGFSNFVVFMFGQLALGYISADATFVTASVLPVGIAILGSTCYFLIGLGASPVLVSDHRGVLVYPLRNLTWAFTTSLMIFSIWYRSGAGRWRLASALILDWAMMGTGLLAAVNTGLKLHLWYWISCACFSGAFYEQWLMMGSMAKMAKDMARAQQALLRLRAALAILWTTFAVTFACQYFLPANWISWHTMDLLTIMADCGAKTVIAGAMSHGIVSTVTDLGIYKLERLALGFVSQIKANNEGHEAYLASMTHELRTPLNGIVALTDTLIMSEDLSPNAAEVLQIVSDSGQRLGKLINNILDHASIQKHKLTLVRQDVDLAKAVEDVAKLVSPILAPGVELSLNIAPDIPLLDGDPVRIMQVLFNLLGNAAKFTSHGTISVSAYAEEDGIKIEVKDTGIGIPEDKLPDIFKAYEMGNKTAHSHSMGSSGLGLSMANQLVELHGGQLSVSSVEGKGSCFTATFPAKLGAVVDHSLPAVKKGTGTPDLVANSRLSKPSARHEPVRSNTPSAKHNAAQANRPKLARKSVSSRTILGASQEAPKATGTLRSGKNSASHSQLSSILSDASTDNNGDDDAAGRHALLSWRMKRRNASHDDIHSLCHPEPGSIEVLSVDDDSVNQMVIEKVMGQVGFKVIKAMDARACLNLLNDRYLAGGVKAFPSIILMDQRMPHMTGIEAAKIIRERYAASRVPIIMLSANDDEGSIVEGLQNGCNDYVTKPFRQMELITRMSLQLRIIQFHQREMEARQNEHILNEILPASIIDRLKAGQTNIADELEEVTILFSDICGFTELAANCSTLDIISMLDDLFSCFDDLVTEHGVYKVETIGDAYMIVSGHDEESRQDHVERMLKTAMAMINAAEGMTTPQGEPLRVRLGLHTGPAYAGIVGHKCPRYCLFGDTVNTASRMESTGFPMTIHMSNSTAQRAMESQSIIEANLCDLGHRSIKGKGHMQTWLLKHGAWEVAMEGFRSSEHSKSFTESRSEVSFSKAAGPAALPTAMSSQLAVAPSGTGGVERLQADTNFGEGPRGTPSAPETSMISRINKVSEQMLEVMQELRQRSSGEGQTGLTKELRIFMETKHLAMASDMEQLASRQLAELHNIRSCVGETALAVAGCSSRLDQQHTLHTECSENLVAMTSTVKSIYSKLLLAPPELARPHDDSQRQWQQQQQPHRYSASDSHSTDYVNPRRRHSHQDTRPSSIHRADSWRSNASSLQPPQVYASPDGMPVGLSYPPSQDRSPPGFVPSPRKAMENVMHGKLAGDNMNTPALDAELDHLLESAGLGHYSVLLNSNGVTLQALQHMQPGDLVCYGVHTPGAQVRIIDAITRSRRSSHTSYTQ